MYNMSEVMLNKLKKIAHKCAYKNNDELSRNNIISEVQSVDHKSSLLFTKK